ncbi:hypothetical protein BH09PAT3_BH09PAT3_5040 [soil metagenome]
MSEKSAGFRHIAYSNVWTVSEHLRGNPNRPLLPSSADKVILKPKLMLERVMQIKDPNHALLLKRSMSPDQFEHASRLSHVAGAISRVTLGMPMFTRATEAYEAAREKVSDQKKLEEMKRMYKLYCVREAESLSAIIKDEDRPLYVVMAVDGHVTESAARLTGIDIVSSRTDESTPELMLIGKSGASALQPVGMQSASLWQQSEMQP